MCFGVLLPSHFVLFCHNVVVAPVTQLCPMSPFRFIIKIYHALSCLWEYWVHWIYLINWQKLRPPRGSEVQNHILLFWKVSLLRFKRCKKMYEKYFSEPELLFFENRNLPIITLHAKPYNCDIRKWLFWTFLRELPNHNF